MGSVRPLKHKNPIALIRQFEKIGSYDFVFHARQRLQQRHITVSEVAFVLRHGHHEVRKDHFSEKHGEWNYAIRGKTADGRTLRLAVAIRTDGTLIITVIDLDKRG